MALAPATPFEIGSDVSAAPARRSTDVSSLTMPISWVWVIVLAIVGYSVTQAVTLSGVRSDMRDVLTRLEERDRRDAERLQADRDIKELEKRYLEQRFTALEAKIEAAGLRNFNAAIATELSKQKPR